MIFDGDEGPGGKELGIQGKIKSLRRRKLQKMRFAAPKSAINWLMRREIDANCGSSNFGF